MTMTTTTSTTTTTTTSIRTDTAGLLRRLPLLPLGRACATHYTLMYQHVETVRTAQSLCLCPHPTKSTPAAMFLPPTCVGMCDFKSPPNCQHTAQLQYRSCYLPYPSQTRVFAWSVLFANCLAGRSHTDISPQLRSPSKGCGRSNFSPLTRHVCFIAGHINAPPTTNGHTGSQNCREQITPA